MTCRLFDMGVMVSQIIRKIVQQFVQAKTEKTSKHQITGPFSFALLALCEGNAPVTCRFTSQWDCIVETRSYHDIIMDYIWWQIIYCNMSSAQKRLADQSADILDVIGVDWSLSARSETTLIHSLAVATIGSDYRTKSWQKQSDWYSWYIC